MSYDKVQATREFKHWSVAYDQSILQRLLFGPRIGPLSAGCKALSATVP